MDSYVKEYLEKIYGEQIQIAEAGILKGVKDNHLARHLVRVDANRTNVVIGVWVTSETIWWKLLESSRY